MISLTIFLQSLLLYKRLFKTTTKLKYNFVQGRRNEGRAKGGNADGKGNFGLMNYIYKVVDLNPQISKPRNSYNAEIKNLYAVVTISLQIVDNKWFTMLR